MVPYMICHQKQNLDTKKLQATQVRDTIQGKEISLSLPTLVFPEESQTLISLVYILLPLPYRC
jgi:hypothetical protein